MAQTGVTMTKDQIIQELEKLPESRWLEVLEFIHALQAEPAPSEQTEPQNLVGSNLVRQSDAWAAYLASKQERTEVYRRLANS